MILAEVLRQQGTVFISCPECEGCIEVNYNKHDFTVSFDTKCEHLEIINDLYIKIKYTPSSDLSITPDRYLCEDPEEHALYRLFCLLYPKLYQRVLQSYEESKKFLQSWQEKKKGGDAVEDEKS